LHFLFDLLGKGSSSPLGHRGTERCVEKKIITVTAQNRTMNTQPVASYYAYWAVPVKTNKYELKYATRKLNSMEACAINFVTV
jgi:hypothetical protein